MQVNKDWFDLIQHARQCHAIIRTRDSDSYQATATCIRKHHGRANLLTSTDPKVNPGSKDSSLAGSKYSSLAAGSTISFPPGSTEMEQRKHPLDATDVQEHNFHIKKKRLDSGSSEHHLGLVGSDYGQPEVSCCSSSSGSNFPPTFSPTKPTAAEVLRHVGHALPTVAELSTTEKLDCTAFNPSLRVSVPPTCEKEWKPHGGPRNRVAHQDSETIQKRRNMMIATAKRLDPAQPRTDKKKKNIRDLLSGTKQ